MRKNILGLFLLVLIVFSACATQRKGSSTLDLDYVQMWRTACFGKCPSYKLEIYKDGLVRFTSVYFTPDSGIFEKNIGAAKAQELLDAFNAKRVDTLQNEYPLPISDLPGINYIFKYNNTTKKVINGQFGPFFLKELAQEVDKLVRTNTRDAPKLDNSWKRVSEGPKGD